MKVFLKSEGRIASITEANLRRAPLFIVSSEGGAALSEGTQPFQIAYAMLFKKGRKLIIRVLRPEVFFPEKGFDEGRRGHRFALGNSRFHLGVAEKERSPASTVKKTLLAGLLAVCAVAVAAAVCRPAWRKNAVQAVEAPKQARFMEVDENAVMEDVTARLRAGDTAQARLTLLQTKGEKADALLKRLEEEGVRPEGLEDTSAKKIASAQKHYDTALEFAKRGAQKDAKRSLDRAFAEIYGLKASPPILSEMEKLKGKVVSQLEGEISTIVFEAEGLAGTAEYAEPRDGIAALKAVKTHLDELHALLPDSKEGALAQKVVDTAVSSAAQRWLAKAESAERLFGCERAVPIYEEIGAALKDADTARAREAKARAELCMGEGI